MAKIIIEIEDMPDGTAECKARGQKLPSNPEDMTKAESIAHKLFIFMRDELKGSPLESN